MVFLKPRGAQEGEAGEFYVRSGPATIKLPPQDVEAYVRTRYRGASASSAAGSDSQSV